MYVDRNLQLKSLSINSIKNSTILKMYIPTSYTLSRHNNSRVFAETVSPSSEQLLRYTLTYSQCFHNRTGTEWNNAKN